MNASATLSFGCRSVVGIAALGLFSGHAPAAQSRDPLENYYGNTLICGAPVTGEDACHIWIERDGKLAPDGRYKLGPIRKDGKVPFCMIPDSRANIKRMRMPDGIEMPPSRMKDPNAGTIAVCYDKNYRTTCVHRDPKTMTAQQVKAALAWRAHQCVWYPLGAHEVGDVWFEQDDPLPAEDGLDKLWLVKGHM